MAASQEPTIAASSDRQYFWWALATFLAALAMAVVLGTRDAEGAANAAIGPLQTILLMTAVMCLPFALAALVAGLALSAYRPLHPLRRQLLRYGATLGVLAFVLVFLATNRWPTP